MADVVNCPECDERVELTAELCKKGAKCPMCGSALGKLVPLALETDATPAKPQRYQRKRLGADRYEDNYLRARASGPKPETWSRFFFGWIVLILLVVGGCLAVVYIVRVNRPNDAPPDVARSSADPVSPNQVVAPLPVWQGPTDTAAAEAALPVVASPFEVDPLLEADARPVYLADMKEFAVRMSPWQFGKGELGDGAQTPIRVKGALASKGLSVHPNNQFATRAAYALGGKATILVGAAALNDYANEAWSPVVFVIVGDGREVWRSRPVNRASGPESFRLVVSGVKVLELRAIGLGVHIGAHAVWVDPHIER